MHFSFPQFVVGLTQILAKMTGLYHLFVRTHTKFGIKIFEIDFVIVNI